MNNIPDAPRWAKARSGLRILAGVWVARTLFDVVGWLVWLPDSSRDVTDIVYMSWMAICQFVSLVFRAIMLVGISRIALFPCPLRLPIPGTPSRANRARSLSSSDSWRTAALGLAATMLLVFGAIQIHGIPSIAGKLFGLWRASPEFVEDVTPGPFRLIGLHILASDPLPVVIESFSLVFLAVWIALSARPLRARFSALFPVGVVVLLLVTRFFPYCFFYWAVALLRAGWIFHVIHLAIGVGFAAMFWLLSRAAEAQPLDIHPEQEQARLKDVTSTDLRLSAERIGTFVAMMIVAVAIMAFVWGACRDKGPRIDQGTGLNTRYGQGGTDVDRAIVGRYFPIWKSLFLRRNEITAGEFDAHILVKETSVNRWNSGASLVVEYTVTIDWVKVTEVDRLIVEMRSDYSAYRHLGIPRDTPLNEAEINRLLELGVDTEIHRLPLRAKLALPSYEAAAKELRQLLTEAHQVRVNKIQIPYGDSNPVISGSGEVDSEKNSCLFATIDLVSGLSSAQKSVCRVH